jgi:Spy/CpxP family protein refolding chaperone
MEDETKLLGQLLPILKPEQREKLAAKMEKGPSSHGRHGGGMSGIPGLDEEEHEGDWIER